MDKIEINEYVRTDKGIIKQILSDKDLVIMKFADMCSYGNIVKHSKNLIDLIEVGDYVNGHKVIREEWGEDDSDLFLKLDGDTHDYNLCSDNQIKTILTKEMYEQNCYKVEVKDE